MNKHDVIIVGAGVSGLTCALHLHRTGYSVLVLEASDGFGGRLRTDTVEGFTLDRGFQVLLTGSPEVNSMLDLNALNLGHFSPNVVLRTNGAFHTISDPLRDPSKLIATARAPVGSAVDKLALLLWRIALRFEMTSAIQSDSETTTLRLLRERRRFSDRFIDCLFRPLSGVLLHDSDLSASGRLFEQTMRLLMSGSAALPAEGMAAIPYQIRASLPARAIQTGERVKQIEAGRVITFDDASYAARAVVLATDGPEALRLAGRTDDTRWQRVSCVYFVAQRPPFSDPALVLNGDGDGPVMALGVPTNVTRTYSSDGRALVAVVPFVARPPTEPVDDIRAQLVDWYGASAREWRHLRTYHVPYALSDSGAFSAGPHEPRIRERLYVCDARQSGPSIDGAMIAGRRTAEAVDADLRRMI